MGSFGQKKLISKPLKCPRNEYCLPGRLCRSIVFKTCKDLSAEVLKVLRSYKIGTHSVKDLEKDFSKVCGVKDQEGAFDIVCVVIELVRVVSKTQNWTLGMVRIADL